MQRFLPSNLQDAIVEKPGAVQLEARRDRLGSVRDALLRAGPFIFLTGLLLLFAVLLRSALNSESRARSLTADTESDFVRDSDITATQSRRSNTRRKSSDHVNLVIPDNIQPNDEVVRLFDALATDCI